MSSKIGEETTAVHQRNVRAVGAPCPECDSGAIYSEGDGKRVCDSCGTWWSQMDRHPTNWRTNAQSEQTAGSSERLTTGQQTLDVTTTDLDVHEECDNCRIHWDGENAVAVSACEAHSGVDA